jgi:hypothetical protein
MIAHVTFSPPMTLRISSARAGIPGWRDQERARRVVTREHYDMDAVKDAALRAAGLVKGSGPSRGI